MVIQRNISLSLEMESHLGTDLTGIRWGGGGGWGGVAHPMIVLSEPTYRVSATLLFPKNARDMASDSCGSPAGVPCDDEVELVFLVQKNSEIQTTFY